MTRATKILLAIFATLTLVGFSAAYSSEDGGVSKASKNTGIGKSTKAAPMSYFNIKPFSLPGKCIDADEGLDEETMLLDQDVFVDCNEGDEGQDWIRHQEGNIVKLESALHPGYCIATEHDHEVVDAYGEQKFLDHVVLSGLITIGASSHDPDPDAWLIEYEPLKTNAGFEADYRYTGIFFETSTTDNSCTNGTVGLMHCYNPATRWYDAGSHLLSLTCWKAGYSTALTVVGDDETSELRSVQVEDVLTTDSTFMFVDSASSTSGGSGTPFFSDRRLKHEITLIDKSPSGIPIYTFKYRSGMKLANGEVLDNKSTFVGAMAQDLLEIAPDAVIMNEEDGYYRVDYSKIDVDFHKL